MFCAEPPMRLRNGVYGFTTAIKPQHQRLLKNPLSDMLLLRQACPYCSESKCFARSQASHGAKRNYARPSMPVPVSGSLPVPQRTNVAMFAIRFMDASAKEFLFVLCLTARWSSMELDGTLAWSFVLLRYGMTRSGAHTDFTR